jgi:hypothetical protein
MADVDSSLLVMRKDALSVASLSDPSDEKAFWLTRPPEERFMMVEYLRQRTYGYDPVAERLQRVLEVAELRTG